MIGRFKRLWFTIKISRMIKQEKRNKRQWVSDKINYVSIMDEFGSYARAIYDRENTFEYHLETDSDSRFKSIVLALHAEATIHCEDVFWSIVDLDGKYTCMYDFKYDSDIPNKLRRSEIEVPKKTNEDL